MSTVDVNDEWVELLAEERGCLERLHESMAEHHEALRSQDPVSINRALQNNLERIETARSAHDRREAFENRLRVAEPIVADAVAVEDALGASMRRIRMHRDAIKGLSQSIRVLNGKNRQMAEHGLDLLRGDFKMLAVLASNTTDRSGDEAARGQLLSLRA